MAASRPGTEIRTVRHASLLLITLLLVACMGTGDDDGSGGSAGPGAATDADGPAEFATPRMRTGDEGPAPAVRVRGNQLVEVGGEGQRTLAELDGDDEEFVHAAVRPGERRTDTVLALVATPEGYELHYLVLDEDGGAGDLEAFPWRMQIDRDTTAYADAPPWPVWAPDGSAVAWLEFDGEGTRLRTVEWTEVVTADTRSERGTAYRLEEVPVGTQLQRWESDGDGTVLVASDGEVEWRIELARGGRTVAMSDA